MREEALIINTFDELLSHEKEIVERINAMPKGGNLFMAHPFMLLEELGIKLNENLIEEIKERESYGSEFSVAAYNAIKETTEKQRIRYRLTGLFRREPANRSDGR